MRVKKVQLVKFKRFDNLTIDLGVAPAKIIALVGPNGCGKSSVFDAFEEELKKVKSASSNEAASFFSKSWFDVEGKVETYDRGAAIKIYKADDTQEFDKKSFYIRTAYRYSSKLRTDSIKAQPDILADEHRPISSIAVDSRLQQNYERLLGRSYQEFQRGVRTGTEVKEELLGRINTILGRVLEIQISNLGDVTENRGQLFFEKGSSKDFPYENLSSGEKEVVDIIIDLVVKVSDFDDTVFCIDEPELHLNTSIQRKLLVEIEALIPDNCQLWVATHSIGFLRALQTELKDKAQVLDFSEKDYFMGEQFIVPIRPTRHNWQRIFQTALEDLTGLMAPKTIVYCEGEPQPGDDGAEQGLDAIVYNQVFEEEYDHALFISSGGRDAEKNASIALKIISKAFGDAKLFLLKDRDTRSGEDRARFLAESANNRMLERREVENYLFDQEVVQVYCLDHQVELDVHQYQELISDIVSQDLKPIQQRLQHLCGHRGSVVDFKLELAKYITKDTSVYIQMKSCIGSLE